MNAIAKQGVARVEAREQYCPWTDSGDRAFEIDVPPVDGGIEPVKETGLQNHTHASRRCLLRLKLRIAAENYVVAGDVRIGTLQDVAILSRRDPRPGALLGGRGRRSPGAGIDLDLKPIDRGKEL